MNAGYDKCEYCDKLLPPKSIMNLTQRRAMFNRTLCPACIDDADDTIKQAFKVWFANRHTPKKE